MLRPHFWPGPSIGLQNVTPENPPHPARSLIITPTNEVSQFWVLRLPPQYPYSVEQLESGRFAILFSRFFGAEVPSEDLGVLGDVYIRVNAHCLQAFGKTSDRQWSSWPGPHSTARSQNPVQHPHFPERYLWYTLSSSNRSLRWYTKDSIRSDISAFTRGLLGKRKDGSATPHFPSNPIKRLPLPSIEEAIRTTMIRSKRRRGAHAELPSGHSQRPKQCASVSTPHEIEVARPGIADPSRIPCDDGLCRYSPLAPSTTTYIPYAELPTDCCIRGKAGIEFPHDAEAVEWAFNGLKTVLPFTRELSEPNDIEGVKWMAAGRDATAPATNTPTNGIAITVIHLPSLAPTSLGHPSPCRTDVLKRIRGSLARNIPVLVTNCLPDSTCGPIGFDAESVRALKGDLDQMTSWEDAGLRSARRVRSLPEDNTRVAGTYRQFLEGSKGISTSCSILDASIYQSTTPWFIRELADDSLAMAATSDVDFFHSSAQPSDHHDLDHNDRQQRALGANLQNSGNWNTLTTAGFYAYPNHESSGSLTYVTMLCGMTLWSLLRLKWEEPKNMTRVVNRQIKMRESQSAYRNLCHNENVCLVRGTVLILPAGYWHEKYTPVHSIGLGGRFLLLDSMHLTEVSRRVDREQGQVATENDNLSLLRLLYRIALAMKCWTDRQILKLPFLAFARMLIKEEDYRAKGLEEWTIPPDDRLQYEAAVKLILAVLKALSVDSRALEEARDDWTSNFPDPGHEIIDLSILHEIWS